MAKLFSQNNSGVYLLGVLAIILAISGPWFDLSVSNHSFVKTYVAGIGIGVLVLFTLYNKYKDFREKEIIYHISYIKLFLGATFILGCLSVLWSVNPDFSITKLLIWVTIIMAFYTAYNLDITEENLRRLSVLLVIAAMSIAIIGILQYLFDAFTPKAGSSFGMTQAANPSSTFGNKNMATQPISMIFPLAVFLILNKNSSRRVLWLAGIGAALMVSFNFYTSTRASWIAISGEIILMSSLLIIKRKSFNQFASWNQYKTTVVIVSLLLFFTLINFNGDGFAPMWEKAAANFDRLTSDIQNNKSLRYQIWAISGEMIANSPFFGTGLGSWFHNLVNEGYSSYIINYVQRVHNDLLELAVEIGLVGLGIFFLAVFAIIYALWAIITRADPKYLLFYFALFESLSGSFVNLQFSFPYQLAMPALLFGIWIGLICRKSELFIRPIKEFKLTFTRAGITKYKNVTLAVNGFIFIIISSIYISWVNMYSALNTINIKRDFDKLEKIVSTPIYHLEAQNIMNFLSVSYLRNKEYNISAKVLKQILSYWPNDYVSAIRYVYVLQQQGYYNQALRYAERVKEIAPANSHMVASILLNLYVKTNQYDKYDEWFNHVISFPESYLADNSDLYPLLIAYSLNSSNTRKKVPQLHQAYSRYYGYNCYVESNLLYYYLLEGDNKKLEELFNKEIQNKDNCINDTIKTKIKNKLKI